VPARRLTSFAVAAGLAAAVLVTVVVSDGGDAESTSSSNGDVVFGLLLIGAPLLAALVARSVASSELLRPVGSVAAVIAALAAVIHVGVAVDEEGAAGLAYGSAAVVTTLLIAAAVARGRDTPAEVVTPVPAALPAAVSGPPLDVLGPLLDARAHATKAVVAWVVVVVVGTSAAIPALALFGWPRVDERVDARVVSVTPEPDGGETALFEGTTPSGRFVRWSHSSDELGWEPGDARTVYLDDRGRVHSDQQLGFAGIPVALTGLFISIFAAFAVRRLWGLWIALWDVRNGADEPRLGFGAVIDDPAPRTWRPLLAVWEHDPTGGERLARPDAVYRADDETSADLQCPSSSVVVRQAWIDTGLWQKAKPRWVGFEDGVAVPHRRVMFGRWYVRTVTKKSEVEAVVPLRHGPPQPLISPVETSSGGRRRSRHRLPSMIAWRLVIAVVAIPLPFIDADRGSSAEVHASRPLR
jgi:hypothetical protein